MQFKGRLRLPDDTGGGIPVDLRLDDIFVVLVAEGETLGEWRMDDVGVERVFSNQFLLDLEGEAMVFVADDPLGFAYEGVAEIESTSNRLDKRWRGRKKKRRASSSATVVDADRVDADRAKERRAAAAEAVPVPSEPTLEQPAARIEAAPDTLAPETVVPQPAPTEILPPAPAPVEPEVAPKSEPAVVEATTPVLPAPLIDESNVEQDLPEVVIESATPTDSVEEAVSSVTEDETVSTDDGDVGREVEEVAALGAEDAPIDTPEIDSEPVIISTEPEYEVEEVVITAAASAFAVVEETRTQPEPVLPLVEDDGFVAVEAAPPAIAAPAEVAHLDSDPQVEDLPVIGAGLVDDPEVEDLPVIGAGLVDEPEVEEVLEEESSSALRSAAAAARAALHEEPEHAAPTDGPADDNAPKHLRERREGRRTRVRRRRKPDVPEHEHTYEVKSAVGGIIRRVCSQCGHVSFGSEDVYEDWGA